MADRERKSLVWSIKKSLLTLTANECFQLSKSVGSVAGKELSMLQVDEERSCTEYVQGFMCGYEML